jgi:hypothetical protein
MAAAFIKLKLNKSGSFSIGLWNLFNTRGNESNDIWNYSKETTGHILDLRTSYNFGESFPLSLEANVFLRGSVDAQNLGFNVVTQQNVFIFY